MDNMHRLVLCLLRAEDHTTLSNNRKIIHEAISRHIPLLVPNLRLAQETQEINKN